MGHSKKERKSSSKKNITLHFLMMCIGWSRREKRGKFFLKKMKQSHHEGGNMGFLKTKIRETKPKKKGLVGKLDVSEIAQDLHLGRSSRVELSRVAAMGLFFYFVLITLLDAYVSLFFLFFLLLIRMSCDLLYLRGGGRGWNSDAVAGIKRLHFFEW